MQFKRHTVDSTAAGIVTDQYGRPETHKLELNTPRSILMAKEAKEEYARALYCALVRELAAALEKSDGAARSVKITNDPTAYMLPEGERNPAGEATADNRSPHIGAGCQEGPPRAQLTVYLAPGA